MSQVPGWGFFSCLWSVIIKKEKRKEKKKKRKKRKKERKEREKKEEKRFINLNLNFQALFAFLLHLLLLARTKFLVSLCNS